LLALEAINESLPSKVEHILPAECLVFEDAVAGVESARNAGMQVIWVPDRRVKSTVLGNESEILGRWGREYESLAQVVLADYGIGV
jgi:pseudouridine 5'-phosphatase